MNNNQINILQAKSVETEQNLTKEQAIPVATRVVMMIGNGNTAEQKAQAFDPFSQVTEETVDARLAEIRQGVEEKRAEEKQAEKDTTPTLNETLELVKSATENSQETATEPEKTTSGLRSKVSEEIIGGIKKQTQEALNQLHQQDNSIEAMGFSNLQEIQNSATSEITSDSQSADGQKNREIQIEKFDWATLFEQTLENGRFDIQKEFDRLDPNSPEATVLRDEINRLESERIKRLNLKAKKISITNQTK